MAHLLIQFATAVRIASVAAVAATTCVLASSSAKAAATANSSAADSAEYFERFVRPILVEKCADCHGAEEPESGLRLDSAEGLFAGGQSGAVVLPGKPDESRLIQLVRGTADLQMPPDDRLSPEAVAALERWVRDGAEWPGYEVNPVANERNGSVDAKFTEEQRSYWAFQPVKDTPPPQVTDGSWPKSPVDHFILAPLEAAGVRPSPPADKRTLLRRVTYDLTGLPPTPEEAAAFLADESPDAFAKVIDRQLASKRYGEKWGQHWLDVARFAESAGHDGNNAYVHAWRFRDYVIKSFNEDKPYDQFIIEQIAGDLLPKTHDANGNYEQLVATGFLQVGPKPVVMRDKRQMLLEIADEQVHTLGVAMLGLTLGCARCHDHKFDPIPTADYYSLAGIFTSTHVMADEAPDSKWLEPTVPTGEGTAEIMAVQDLPQPANLRIHMRGNYRTLGAEAPRRFLQIIAGAGHEPIPTSGSGRLELAHWIASRENPLTARVMVNRIWQYHFGRGLVPTSDNFGRLGEPPSHPELLDWLATRFVESGWSIKAMHRMLLATQTYQQACIENPEGLQIDPDNRLLWRMPRRRLTAEEVRDSMLAVSGGLDLTSGGSLFTEGFGPGDESRKLYVVDISGRDPYPPFESTRRSVYLPVLRNARPEALKLFDAANEQASTAVRGETTVAPQALFLLNSPFMRQRSLELAVAVLAEGKRQEIPGSEEPVGEAKSIELAYKKVIGRLPTNEEQSSVRQFLDAYQRDYAGSEIPAADLDTLVSQAAARYEAAVRETSGLQGYYRSDSIEFDGASRSLRFDLPPRPTNAAKAIAIELWLRPEEVRTATAVGCDDPVARVWRIGTEAREESGRSVNRLFYEFYAGGAGGRVVAEGPAGVVSTGEWSHIVVTYGEGKRRLYLNGELIHEQPTGSVMRPFNAPLVIGARGDRNEWFRGRIDHVSVYDRALSEAEAQRHYHLFQQYFWPKEDFPRLFAWRAFCQTLLCSNEFFYVE